MNVILCENNENLGVMGDRVSEGRRLPRNFLIPRETRGAGGHGVAKQIQHEWASSSGAREARTEMTAVADQCAPDLEFHMRAGEEEPDLRVRHRPYDREKLAGPATRSQKSSAQEPIKPLGIYNRW
jgi:ribosomal protein L9